jgi:hypothetical protein
MLDKITMKPSGFGRIISTSYFKDVQFKDGQFKDGLMHGYIRVIL